MPKHLTPVHSSGGSSNAWGLAGRDRATATMRYLDGVLRDSAFVAGPRRLPSMHVPMRASLLLSTLEGAMLIARSRGQNVDLRYVVEQLVPA